MLWPSINQNADQEISECLEDYDQDPDLDSLHNIKSNALTSVPCGMATQQ
jgi:hypothetical protein